MDILKDVSKNKFSKSPQFFEKYAAVKELNVKAYDRIRREIHSGCTEQELYEKVLDT